MEVCRRANDFFFCDFVIDLLQREIVSSLYEDRFFIVLLRRLLVCGQFR